MTSPLRSNIELIQAAVAAYNWNDMEDLGALCTEDVTVIPFEGWPDDPIYCGREGIIRLVSGWWDNFDGTAIKLERIEAVGDRVLALLLQSGLQQGVRVEQRLGSIYESRDGLISRMEFFLGYEGALETAGLS